MNKTTLRAAYAWTCESCGCDNFENGIVAEFSPDDEVAMREKYGVDGWVTGEWLVQPDEVVCRHCDEAFEVEMPASEECDE